MGDGRRRDTEESVPCKAAPGKQQVPPLGVANSPEKVARLARLERAASCLEVSLIGANELSVGPFFVVTARG